MTEKHRPNSHRNWITPEECRALLGVLRSRWRDHAVMLVGTGVCSAELHAIEPADVDRQDLTLEVRGRSARLIPISQDICQLLAHRIERHGDGHLFEPWTNARRQLPQACLRARVPPVTPGDLQRTFIAWLAEAGVSEFIALILVGRGASRVVRELYGVADFDAMRAAVERLPSVEVQDDDDHP